jgi:uncharacterized protein YijF (DUF1287 family)
MSSIDTNALRLTTPPGDVRKAFGVCARLVYPKTETKARLQEDVHNQVRHYTGYCEQVRQAADGAVSGCEPEA